MKLTEKIKKLKSLITTSQLTLPYLCCVVFQIELLLEIQLFQEIQKLENLL